MSTVDSIAQHPVHCSPLADAFDRAADLAHDLADLAQRTESAALSKLATDASAVAERIHVSCEALAELAGVEVGHG
jgi:hypothetical protein